MDNEMRIAYKNEVIVIFEKFFCPEENGRSESVILGYIENVDELLRNGSSFGEVLDELKVVLDEAIELEEERLRRLDEFVEIEGEF